MSTVVLGQLGHLGPGTWWCHNHARDNPGCPRFDLGLGGVHGAYQGHAMAIPDNPGEGGKLKKSYLIPTLRSENHADVSTECIALQMLQPSLW